MLQRNPAPVSVVLPLLLCLFAAACGGGEKAVSKDTTFPVLDLAKTTTAVKDNYFQDDKAVFSSSRDRQAIVWVRLKFIDKPHQMAITWYDPAGAVYHQTESFEVNEDGGLHKYSISYHQIDISKMKTLDLLGEWTVVVKLDDKPLVTKKLTIDK
ncbi:MAG: hypothetical protein HYV63_20550 [Candidatus Schekmanbacteria bacterium]|nr:hypothetical protein [Candidatus Schekmanbacteria bacterium]